MEIQNWYPKIEFVAVSILKTMSLMIFITSIIIFL